MIKLLTYDGQRPDADLIKKLVRNKDYTYIVATKALERERKEDKVIPDCQQFLDSAGRPNKVAVFGDLVWQWVKEVMPIASRGEEKLTLLRAMRSISASDEVLKEVLKKDISAWIKALSDLASEGIDLSGGLDGAHRSKLVNPFVGDLIIKLQQKYYQELGANNRQLFERAARIFFEKNYDPTPIIIMEGFTYLTGLQRYYVEICDGKGAKVIFLAPYSDAQKKGFEIIKRTYSYFTNLKEEKINTEPISNHDELQFLQSGLFAQSASGTATPAGHISLRCYPNRDREIIGCIRQLQMWFDGGYQPKDVAVVMRRPADFLERFHDYLAMNSLTYILKSESGAEERRPVEVFVP